MDGFPAELARVETDARSASIRVDSTLYPIDAGMIFDGRIQTMGTLARYESAIERQLNRATTMLERRQARRFERWKRRESGRDDPPAERDSAAPPKRFRNVRSLSA